MIDSKNTPKVATITAINVMGGQSGVGLRWVLGVSLSSMIVVSVLVVGANIASYATAI